MTERPASVRIATGRSPPSKSTQPAVTQRRRSCSSHASDRSRSAPKVGVRSRPERVRRGSSSPFSSLTAACSPNCLWMRATADSALRTTSVVSSALVSAAASSGRRRTARSRRASRPRRRSTEDRVVPAAAPFGPAHQLEEQVPLVRDHRLVGRVHLQQPAPQRQVGGRDQQQPERGGAVTPGAPDLLVVRLDRAGRAQVHDRAHVRRSMPMPKALVATITSMRPAGTRPAPVRASRVRPAW
jgi:hypothetical protein